MERERQRERQRERERERERNREREREREREHEPREQFFRCSHGYGTSAHCNVLTAELCRWWGGTCKAHGGYTPSEEMLQCPVKGCVTLATIRCGRCPAH